MAQKLGEARADLRMLQRELYRGLEIAQLVAAVETAALEFVGENLLILEQLRDAVGELDLAAGACRHGSQVMEDARREHVATHHGEGRRCSSRLRLLHDSGNAAQAPPGIRRFDDAIARHVCGGYRHHPDHGILLAGRNLGHLLHHRNFRVDKVVGEQHGERLAADYRFGTEHRVTQTQRLGLADVDEVDAARQHGVYRLEQLGLAARSKLGLQLVGLVEMILDGALVAARDEDHVGDAGRGGLLHRILDQRLVDHRQHFLGACFRYRQKPAAEAGDGKYGLGYLTERHDGFLFSWYGRITSRRAKDLAQTSSRTESASSPDQGPQFLFVQHLHAQLARAVELAAWIGSRDHIVRLLRNAAGDLASLCLDQLLGFVSGKRRQCSSQYERDAGKLAARRAARRLVGPLYAGLAQLGNHLAVVGFGEELADALREDRPDVVDLQQLVLVRFDQRLDAAEVAREILRSRLADVPDAQRKDEPRQGRPAALVDGGQQVRRGLVSHTLQPRERRYVELVQVGRCMHHLGVDELIHELVAQA